jgi:hypothetical protein
VLSIAEQLTPFEALNKVVVPDIWQQQAVSALRQGQDVVVHAPTGAGKTLIFELWSNQGKNRGQAIYTVPTRALANDKLAEWRARGWDVGIATGDLAENLQAPIVVATLETQKSRLIQGQGPNLLVVDEYQMIGDADRGLNYELALALAPAQTQLLLLSGSVANPHDIVKWLQRLGRSATLIRNEFRPVPLDEVHVEQLHWHIPNEIRGYWPRVAAKALAEDLGPILIFAPRRQAAEALAAELARYLPTPNPLPLSAAQKQLAGEHLAKLLKSRIAFHHSGMSYGARAGVVEPLAKAGQLRIVVATMGLAAGINFSLRSVALAGESYRRDFLEQPLKADEILQMAGRAGRRGIDETGYFLITANQIRIANGYPCHLLRSGMVDWSALLGLMSGAAAQGREPYSEAVRVQQRLFTSKPIILGVEESLKHPVTPCGLKTDAERARLVRKQVRQFLNSRGEWQAFEKIEDRPIGEIRIAETSLLPVAPPSAPRDTPPEMAVFPMKPAMDEASLEVRLRPALSSQAAIDRVGIGCLVRLSAEHEEPVYGRSMIVADKLHDGRYILVKWMRRMVNWHGRDVSESLWREKVLPSMAQRLALQKTPVVRWVEDGQKVYAWVSLAEIPMRVPVDRHGAPLWKPAERQVISPVCGACSLVDTCRKLSPVTGTAMIWRRLGLVDESGAPTRRGTITSFFSQGDGLAVAAGLEDAHYALGDMVYDLANLDASFRFCGDENRWGGRLAMACQRLYELQCIPGYLENGVPPHYGAGAEQIVAATHKNPQRKVEWATDMIGVGDIDRIIIEWRSMLRRIAHAPKLDWDRWTALQKIAGEILAETQSPTLTDLPPLETHQTRRQDHKLILKHR